MTCQQIKNTLGKFVNKANKNELKYKKIKKAIIALKIAHILIEKRRNYMKTSRGYNTKRSQEKKWKKIRSNI